MKIHEVNSDKLFRFMFAYTLNMSSSNENTNPHPRLKRGPHGVGDPDDRSLRKVEIEVLIPQKMRDIAKTEKCVEEVQRFTDCCKNSSIAMVVLCRKENSDLKNCLARWYQNEDFRKRCTDEYIDERSDYRRTGKSKKYKESLRGIKAERQTLE